MPLRAYRKRRTASPASLMDLTQIEALPACHVASIFLSEFRTQNRYALFAKIAYLSGLPQRLSKSRRGLPLRHGGIFLPILR